ncbi:thiamine-phosphate pyrophosphorylase [Metabacillus crassostreae]|uniref:thiamine phosphate synthase n=1 Tax=Metabacillus crassostreae TaxID=929098 RepID=UPI00195AC0BB|nr:thiamine-phosphate pyrophosphorylase [Metabacillus crassostreae]
MSRIAKNRMQKLLNVYFIMGSNNCKIDPALVLQQAIKGGITLFQFREKGTGALTGNEKFKFAEQLQNICRINNIPFIVNDDIELALALDADGIHIGQDDGSAEEVRKKIGDNKILGVSTHNLEEVKKAIAEGADYVGIGPIYSTTTKEDAKTAQGTALIKEVRSNNIEIPIVGIGGITAENASPVIEHGGNGVAVISEISLAEDPGENAMKLNKVVKSFLK